MRMVHERKNRDGSERLAILVDMCVSEYVVVPMDLSKIIEEVNEMYVKIAHGSILRSRHKGKVPVDLGSTTLNFSPVLYISAFHLSTLPCSRLDEHGISKLVYRNYSSLIDRSNDDVVLGRMLRSDCDGLHTVKNMEQKDNSKVLAMSATDEAPIVDISSNCNRWHEKWPIQSTPPFKRW